METRGIDSFAEFHEWSVDDPDGFWSMVIDDIDIRFDVEPTAIRGSDDVTSPEWLPGARFNIVSSCLDHDPDAVAIVSAGPSGSEVTTVGELSVLVARFAAGFARAGFSVGDAIAIVMPMNKEAVVAYLGIIAGGGVVVAIADSFAPDEIATRLHISDAVAVVTQVEAVRMGKRLPMYSKCVDAGASRCIVVGSGPLRDGFGPHEHPVLIGHDRGSEGDPVGPHDSVEGSHGWPLPPRHP
jgi:acetyl-CoA synthetase